MKKIVIVVLSILSSGCASQQIDYATPYPKSNYYPSYPAQPYPKTTSPDERYKAIDKQITELKSSTAQIKEGLKRLDQIEGRTTSEPEQYYTNGTSSQLYNRILSE